jgi:hypothetical protein
VVLVLVNVCAIVAPLDADAPVILVLLEIVQEKETPLVMLDDREILVAAPEQIGCEEGVGVIVGLGLTVILKVIGIPEQTGVEAAAFVYFGVTVMVASMGALPVFVAVNTGIVPVPPAPNPMAVLLLLHSKTVLSTAPLNEIAEDELL